MLVICDSEKAVAVAGVMGGANSEVTEQTCNILLEAASFKATSIHATGEALGLASESRYRFERGIAPGLTVPALKRATELIVELGEGQAAQGWLDVYPGCQENRAIKLSQNKLQRLLGLEYSLDEIKNNLKSLGIECRDGSQPGEIAAFSPYWRSDINIEADLIEEVARIQGYDRIPTTLLAEPLPSLDPDPILSLKDKIRNGLVANGFAEVLNFSLVSKEILENITAEKADIAGSLLRVANPMTADMEYLRTSLRGTLLSAFADNRKYREGSIRLFELGKIYLKREKELPDERETVCAVIGGQRYDRSWQNRDEKIDFFDAKGIVESLLMRLGLEASFEKGVDGGLHPNRQAAIYLSRQCIGVLGEIHPKVALRFEISEPLYLIELDLKNMVNLASAGRGYRPVGKFPSIMRDLALVVDAGVTNQQIQKIIKGFNWWKTVKSLMFISADRSHPAGNRWPTI
jgi:phenylalanyl-tRNA synthetase beta chain